MEGGLRLSFLFYFINLYVFPFFFFIMGDFILRIFVKEPGNSRPQIIRARELITYKARYKTAK